MERRPSSLELPFVAVDATPPEPLPPAAPRAARVRLVLSVAELDRRLKSVVERATDEVEVEGEISGLKVVASGHSYFTLKDEREEATIDCVMYRTASARGRRLLADGARVVLGGRVTVYVARGRLQLVADTATLSGRGAVLEALEKLKEKLAGEGLFALEKKRALPRDPRVIGVVTSADGAVIHDIVKVAARRGRVRIVLARAPVQGAGAAQRIVRAITALEALPEIEAIVIARGGGSAEDLAAFNDEGLARKVASARVPIVSAVGHEVDVTLTDLAADARASTPSQAAEMLVPDDEARRAELAHLRGRLERAMSQELRAARHVQDRLRAELGSPERLLDERQQLVDEARMRLRDQTTRLLVQRRATVERLDRRLAARHPSAVLSGARATLAPLEVRLGAAARRLVAARRRDLSRSVAGLDALSPLAVLGRGYAIATDAGGRALVDAAAAHAGDRLRVRLHRGTLEALVVEADPPAAPRGSERRTPR